MIWDFSNSVFGAAPGIGNLFLYEVSGFGAAPIPTALGDGSVRIGGLKVEWVTTDPTSPGGIF